MARLSMTRWACIQAMVICFTGGVAATVQAAPDLLPGTYRCSAYNVSGGAGSCRNMPSLVLHPDGSYQFSSTRGRWSVNGGKLLLSEAQIWGMGEILDSSTVRFEYDYRGWRHTVTWLCQECAPTSGSPPVSHKVADGSGLQEFMNTVNEVGKAFDGLRGRGKKDRKPAESGGTQPSPPPAYPPGQSTYSGSDPSAYPAAQPAYPAPDPSASNPQASPGYPGGGPPQSYPSDSPAYPGPAPSAAYPPSPAGYPDGGSPSSYPAASPGYSAGGTSTSASNPAAPSPTPAPADPGRSGQGYGPPPDGQAPSPPSQQPKCHPLIPKYSQPGCVE